VPEHNASQRAGQRKLREQMRGLGMSRAEITAEMARRYKLRPRAAWRIAWGWTLEEAAERYNALRARDQAQALASLTGSRLSEWENWPFSTRKPAITSLYLLAGIYHCAVLDLTDVHDREKLPAAELLALGKTSTPPHSRHEDTDPRGDPQSPVVPPARAAAPAITSQDATALAGQAHPDTGPDTVVAALSRPPASRTPGGTDAGERRGTDELAMRAADETCDLASHDARFAVPSLSVSRVMTQARDLAQHYSAMTPLEFLARGRAVRNEAIRLSERTRRPSQLADLYLTAGMACSLMAFASVDLGCWTPAIEQAEGAAFYGDAAGHRGLQSWTAGFLALVAFWCGNPGEAVQYASRGLRVAPPGTPQARLHCISARAWAHLGDPGQVQEELAAADHARNCAGGDDLHDKIGGEFGWGAARHAMCAGTALLLAGDIPAAAGRAAEAIQLSGSGERVELYARADLARAEILRGQLGHAREALLPVWDVQEGQRRYPLLSRLEHAAASLDAPQYARSRGAAELKEQIADFTCQAVPRQLSGNFAAIEPRGQ
jgi:hypothetical protein